jgi:hypothetical protein
MRARLLASLSLGTLLLVPAAAPAALDTFGSDLSRPADRVETEQRDIAYWQTAFAGGRPTTAPTDGQIRKIEVRGFARTTVAPGDPSAPGSPVFFLQALAPEGGNVRARLSSQPFYLPGAATGTADTVTAFAPENFCVKAGESLSMTGVGGWDGGDPDQTPYSGGTPFQTFASADSSTVRFFTANEGLKNGSLFTPRSGEAADALVDVVRTELLMRMTLATGDDRSYECGGPNTYRPADADKPGGSSPAPVYQKARIPEQRLRFSSTYKSGLSLICAAGPSRCKGALTVRAGRRSTLVAKARFDMAGKTAGRVNLRLSASGRKLWLRSDRRLPARVMAVTGAGGPNFTDVRPLVLGKRGR